MIMRPVIIRWAGNQLKTDVLKLNFREEKTVKKTYLCVAIVLFAFVCVTAQDRPRLFIAPMENGLNEFLTAAIIKVKLPVQLVISDENADYVIIGKAIKGEGKWYDTIFGTEKDRNQGSITLLKASDKSIVWAGSAGDKRGFWDTAWSKGGQRRVAERLAKQLKKEYFNGKSK